MKTKIVLFKRIDKLPIPSVAFFNSLNVLAKNINPDTTTVTTVTLSHFFACHGVLAVAMDEKGMVSGIATLVHIVKINGFSARLEHVSVLPEHEGQGIGRLLVAALIHDAREHGVRRIDLSCESRRVRANKLYEDLGFKIRETNSRRLILVP